MTQYLAKNAIDIQPKPVVNDEMVVDLAFLIPRGKQQGFDDQIRRKNEAIGDEINFRITGPLPPYSFCTVEIKRINSARIEEVKQILGGGTHISDKELRGAYCYSAAKSHPCTYFNSGIGDEHFITVQLALGLLNDYCQRQSESVKYNPYNRCCSLPPEEVSRAFLIEIKRATCQTLDNGSMFP